MEPDRMSDDEESLVRGHLKKDSPTCCSVRFRREGGATVHVSQAAIRIGLLAMLLLSLLFGGAIYTTHQAIAALDREQTQAERAAMQSTQQQLQRSEGVPPLDVSRAHPDSEPVLDQSPADATALALPSIARSPSSCASSPFQVVMHGGFKWDHTPVIWSSVFLGTNDRIGSLEELGKQLSSMPPEEFEFVSVVGGMKFLSALEHFNPGRISLFDYNINELTKAVFAIEILCASSYEEWQSIGLTNLEKSILAQPAAFYIPAGLASRGVNFLYDEKTFKWTYEGKPASYFTLLPPTVYPEYQWKASSPAGFARVQSLMCGPNRVLSPHLHLRIPPLQDRPRQYALVFASHIEIITEATVREAMPDALYAAPLYSHMHQMGQNRHVLDPHPPWQYTIERLLIGNSLHVWSAIDAPLKGGRFDRGWTASTVEEDFLTGKEPPGNWDTLITHIVIGKHLCSSAARLAELGQGVTPETAAAYAKQQLAKMIARAVQLARKRILVAEFDPSSGQHEACHPGMPDRNQLAVLIREQTGSVFEITKVREVGGNGHPSRNLVFILDKKE